MAKPVKFVQRVVINPETKGIKAYMVPEGLMPVRDEWGSLHWVRDPSYKPRKTTKKVVRRPRKPLTAEQKERRSAVRRARRRAIAGLIDGMEVRKVFKVSRKYRS